MRQKTNVLNRYNLIGTVVYSRGSLLGNALHFKFRSLRVCSTWLSNRACTTQYTTFRQVGLTLSLPLCILQCLMTNKIQVQKWHKRELKSSVVECLLNHWDLIFIPGTQIQCQTCWAVLRIPVIARQKQIDLLVLWPDKLLYLVTPGEILCFKRKVE